MAKLQSGTRIYGNTSIATFLTVGTNVAISGANNSTSNSTGALVISAGGLGVVGNVYTGNVVITGSGNGITFVDGTVQTTAASASAGIYANGAFTQANAAFAAANSGASAAFAFTQANSAFSAANSASSYANSAFIQANSASAYANAINLTQNTSITAAFIQANAAFNTANSSSNTATAAYGAANGAFVQANSASAYANAINLTQNTSITAAFIQANAAFIQANAVFTQSNTYVWPTANLAYAHANAAFVAANSAGGSASAAAFTQANAAFAQANAAFTKANTGTSSAGSAITYTRNTFTATVGQTTFTTTYTVGYLQVFVNGILLATSDYTATNGTTFTLNIAANTGDLVEAAAFSSGSYTRNTFTATVGQTAFTSTYTVGQLQVYINGVFLATSDYTATNGTTFTLNIAANTGDLVEAINVTSTTTSSVTIGKSIAMAMIFGS